MKIRNGKIAPSGFLHKQLDITIIPETLTKPTRGRL
jgi:hypothetical protein